MNMSDEPTYAEQWADSINNVYDDEYALPLDDDDLEEGEDYEDAVKRILNRAACALRGYADEVTFTGRELDIVRHMMPAHEVHQSGSVRWVLDNHGHTAETKELLNQTKTQWGLGEAAK
jgi:hypothetical protein